MAERFKQAIIIDLNQFKLQIHLKNKVELTLHFNSPSRRFYLSLIALVVNEMKKMGKIASIPLEEHLELLTLLNETVGASAGSSDKRNLLQRIYRKWKDALPDLEAAPLFKVFGRKKEYAGGIGKTYRFTEAEKDSWANLFEYKGSEENVRLRFSIDKLGATLDDTVIKYEEPLNASAWEGFISNLTFLKNPEPPVSPSIPDKPSIAVLPFVNMSGDPQDEYLSDSLTEEITTALSKIPDLFVIARSSSFTYKGKSVKVKQVSEDLGVRYVLEGSLRKSENKVRISVQLIDALRDHHVWAERYDRDLKDIFALQDEITMQIITALQVKLTIGEVAHMWARGTKNLEAFTKVLQAMANSTRQTKEGVAIARKLTEEAIALDPKYPRAYFALAQTHLLDILLGTTESPPQSLATALELTEKAIALDESDADSHSLLGYVYTMMRQHDKALSEAERAVNLNPNSFANILRLGFVLLNAGRAEEAIKVLKGSRRLSPTVTYQSYFLNLTMAYRLTGQYKEAVETAKEGLQQVSNNILLHLQLAAAHSLMGREKEARAAAEEVLKINPKFSLERYAGTVYFKSQSDVERTIEALRQAGLE